MTESKESKQRRFAVARTYLLWRFMAAGLSLLPEWLAELIADSVGVVLERRGGEAKEMLKRHLRRVVNYSHPETNYDDAALARDVRAAYRSYARYWVDGARIGRTRKRTIRRRMWVSSNYEKVKAALDSGRGVVLALPHVGSWEWGGAFLALDGYPMTAVAERIEPPKLFEWFFRQRERMGIRVVPHGLNAGVAIVRVLKRAGFVGLLCDRDIEGDGVEVEFFGEVTTLPAGPATLALRTGAALFAAVVYANKGGMHIAEIGDPIEIERSTTFRHDVTRVTQEIAHQFERFIAHAPSQWHLFQPNWPSDVEF